MESLARAGWAGGWPGACAEGIGGCCYVQLMVCCWSQRNSLLCCQRPAGMGAPAAAVARRRSGAGPHAHVREVEGRCLLREPAASRPRGTVVIMTAA